MKNDEKEIVEQTSSKIKVELVDIDGEDNTVELKLAANCSNG